MSLYNVGKNIYDISLRLQNYLVCFKAKEFFLKNIFLEYGLNLQNTLKLLPNIE